MKRFWAPLMVIVICLSLCACGNDQIKNVENLIEAFDKIGYLSGFRDTLHLTEHAEIHHNEWTAAYAKALDAYNALSEKEKAEVKNAYALTRGIYAYERGCYNDILIEQEIVLRCKEAAVEALKDSLINKSSYEEYDWKLYYSYYLANENRFYLKLEINYSAIDKMGSRVDHTGYAICKGTYQNGKITITELSS